MNDIDLFADSEMNNIVVLIQQTSGRFQVEKSLSTSGQSRPTAIIVTSLNDDL